MTSMTIIRTVVVSVSFSFFLAACSAEVPEAISKRQENFKSLGAANKTISDELEKPDPSVAVIRDSAKSLGDLVPHIPTWFPEGSGPETGAETAALAVIWEQRAEFEEAAANVKNLVGALNVAAAGDDITSISAAAAEVGPGCKNCHNTFRLKK